MKTTCQAIVILMLIGSLFITLYRDIHGRKEQEPRGFEGVVVTLISWSAIVFVYYKAGLFNQ